MPFPFALPILLTVFLARGLCAHGLKARLVEHPLNGSVEEDGVVEIGNLAVEPEVDAGDGRVLEVSDVLAQRRALGSLREDAVERVEGQGEDDVVEGLKTARGLDRGRWLIRAGSGRIKVPTLSLQRTPGRGWGTLSLVLIAEMKANLRKSRAAEKASIGLRKCNTPPWARM